MIDEATLDRHTLLHGLSAAARHEIGRRGVVRTFAPDTVLWRAGSPPRGLFLVLDGEVRVVRDEAGRAQVVHTEGPGGTLGDVALFHGDAYPATAIATRRTVCVVIGKDALIAAMRTDPALALALLERLAHRVRMVVERLHRLGALSVPARLAAWLLARQRVQEGPFTLGATQAQLAEELGTVREMITRSLRRLRDGNLVTAVGRGRYIVTDEQGLRALAESAAD